MGKSCLLLRFADDTYTESYISTIGVSRFFYFLVRYERPDPDRSTSRSAPLSWKARP